MILFFDFGFHQVDPVTGAVNVTLDTSGRTFLVLDRLPSILDTMVAVSASLTS